jgi:hypothetical protein
LVLGILHGVRGEFPDDVSGAAVVPIITGHESDPQRLPKGRREIYLAHRAKSLKPKINVKHLSTYLMTEILNAFLEFYRMLNSPTIQLLLI